MAAQQPQAGPTTLASFEGGAFGYQMVDATYKARCRFLIPTRTVKINKALLHFSLQPFRSGAASGTSAGVTGNESANHTHPYTDNTGIESVTHWHGTPTHQHVTMRSGLWLGGLSGTAAVGTDGSGAPGGDVTGGPPATTFHTDTSGAGASGNPNVNHSHGMSGTTGGMSLDHNHSIPGSSLSVPNSLYETGMAQGSRVYIDGTDVTGSLGGPWGTGAALDVHDLDVSQWLSAKGWHEVQISSTSIGGIFPSLAIFAVVGV